jgi:hypothetical protein
MKVVSKFCWRAPPLHNLTTLQDSSSHQKKITYVKNNN